MAKFNRLRAIILVTLLLIDRNNASIRAGKQISCHTHIAKNIFVVHLQCCSKHVSCTCQVVVFWVHYAPVTGVQSSLVVIHISKAMLCWDEGREVMTVTVILMLELFYLNLSIAKNFDERHSGKLNMPPRDPCNGYIAIFILSEGP